MRIFLFTLLSLVLCSSATLAGDADPQSAAQQKKHAPNAFAVKQPLPKDATVYLAGPLFTEAEKQWWKQSKQQIQKALPEARLIWPGESFPLEEIQGWGDQALHHIFARCRDHAASADMIIALLDGPMVDDGTAWEIGYYYALQRGPIFCVRTDFRNSGDTRVSQVNAMVEGSCNAIYPDVASLLADLRANGGMDK